MPSNQILMELQTIPLESDASYYWNAEMAIVPESRGVENLSVLMTLCLVILEHIYML